MNDSDPVGSARSPADLIDELRALYDTCGITYATYEATCINGGNVVRCRLCGHGNGEPHLPDCGVGRFEAALARVRPQCTGPFSDAFDCPVHDPRTQSAAVVSPVPARAESDEEI